MTSLSRVSLARLHQRPVRPAGLSLFSNFLLHTRWLQQICQPQTATQSKGRHTSSFPSLAHCMSSNVEVIFDRGDMSMQARNAVRDGHSQYWRTLGTLRHERVDICGTDHDSVQVPSDLCSSSEVPFKSWREAHFPLRGMRRSERLIFGVSGVRANSAERHHTAPDAQYRVRGR